MTSTIGHPIPHADVYVEGINHVVQTAKFGDYWRILLPGRYNITVAARGYESYTEEVIVPENGTIEYNVTLMRADGVHWSSAYDFGDSEKMYHAKYRSNTQLYQEMAEYENKYPKVASFEGGDNYISMNIHSVKITNEVA